MDQLSPRYLQLLRDWVGFGARSIYQPTPDSETACYGPGNHSHWSIQTNANVFAGLAVLATDPAYTPGTTGISADEMRVMALKILRFLLRGHVSGPGATYDGKPWGNSWISALAIERMAHGIEALEESFTDEDRSLLRQVYSAECDWLVDKYEVKAGLHGKSGHNRPESNIWNGAILHRTAMMWPELPRSDDYRAMGTRFLLNGISIPDDATSAMVYEGRPLSDWHVGANFTREFGLHHHGYLNVGYMIICLSNIAMLHFSYKKRGLSAPPALYHHAEQLWGVVKAFIFPDGRLLRIGGDSRVRYCYCQDYAIPTWLLALDVFGDIEVSALEQGWLDIVATEQATNDDRSFLAGRMAEMEDVSPMYYHRLEGDRVSTLSMGAYWRRIYHEFADVEPQTITPPDQWQDRFHGAVFVRSESRLASFVWEAAQRPCGLCVPPGDSSLAEWGWNMVGKIEGCSIYNEMRPTLHSEHTVPGGFHTYGEGEWWSMNHIAEGQPEELTAVHRLAFAALPDNRTVVVMQQAKTVNRTFIKSVKGLFLSIPNDIFNDRTRSYSWGGEAHALASLPERAVTLATGEKSVAIDGKMVVSLAYGADEIHIHRPAQRQVTLFDIYRPTYGRSGGNLYCDELCAPCITDRRDYAADSILFDVGFVVSTVSSAPEILETRVEGDMRTIVVKGHDGVVYTVSVDFAAQCSALR